MAVRNLGALGPLLQGITKALGTNQNLLKLLYYGDDNPLAKADFTPAEIKDKINGKLLLVRPRIPATEFEKSFVVIRVTDGQRLSDNQDFQRLGIVIESFVPMTQWIIANELMRPYAIMGEIQEALDGKIFNNFGKLHLERFHLNFTTDEVVSHEQFFSVNDFI